MVALFNHGMQGPYHAGQTAEAPAYIAIFSDFR